MSTPLLFTPIRLADLEIKNRIFMSPMCQYSAVDGVPNEWHSHHWAARAVGGVGLVMVEATAVSPEGRISLGDLGIWNETQKEAFERMIPFAKDQGARVGVQLAHAGRKASRQKPWETDSAIPAANGGYIPQGPSELAFGTYEKPHALTQAEIDDVIADFKRAAQRALDAGFEVIELHYAHGYLIHEFLSPLSNLRTDQYGGSFDNRIRLAVQIVDAVRSVWPRALPLFVRLSASDWKENGWNVDESVKLSRVLKERGVELIDCSSGGLVPDAKIPAGPHYQVPFSRQIKQEAQVVTGAVGIITDPKAAEGILKEGEADVVFLGRELLRNPYWPFRAAKELAFDLAWPVQYERAKR